MKKYSSNHYTGISSIEDIKLEKTRLQLKGKLLESRMTLDLGQVREKFSLAAIAASFARSFVLPRISDLIGVILKKVEDDKL